MTARRRVKRSPEITRSTRNCAANAASSSHPPASCGTCPCQCEDCDRADREPCVTYPRDQPRWSHRAVPQFRDAGKHQAGDHGDWHECEWHGEQQRHKGQLGCHCEPERGVEFDPCRECEQGRCTARRATGRRHRVGGSPRAALPRRTKPPSTITSARCSRRLRSDLRPLHRVGDLALLRKIRGERHLPTYRQFRPRRLAGRMDGIQIEQSSRFRKVLKSLFRFADVRLENPTEKGKPDVSRGRKARGLTRM